MTESTLDYDDAFPSCHRTFAELRLYSDSIGPEEMASRLELEPTQMLKKGRKTLRSNGHEKVDLFNAFFLSSRPSVASRDLRRHLDWLLAMLAGKEEALAGLMRSGEVSVSIDCVWESAAGEGGPIFRADQLAVLAELQLELSVDFTLIY